MQAHQKFVTTGHFTGYDMMRLYMRREGWPVPPDDSVDAFAYVSQLQQVEGVGLALEADRRAWPRTSGSLYWQLDDSWPVVSWSGRDYFGRRKALEYEARRVFAPVTVLADLWADTLHVWALSDTGRVRGRVEVRVLDMNGEAARVAAAMPVTLVGGVTPLSWSWPVDSVLRGAAARRTVIDARLMEEGAAAETAPVSRDLAYAARPVELELPDPGMRILSAHRDGDAWTVKVTAERFAYGVHLTVDGEGARFSANDFSLLPGESRTVVVTPDRPTPDLPDRLRVRTLAGLTGG